jgi:hypothetical protein
MPTSKIQMSNKIPHSDLNHLDLPLKQKDEGTEGLRN